MEEETVFESEYYRLEKVIPGRFGTYERPLFSTLECREGKVTLPQPYSFWSSSTSVAYVYDGETSTTTNISFLIKMKRDANGDDIHLHSDNQEVMRCFAGIRIKQLAYNGKKTDIVDLTLFNADHVISDGVVSLPLTCTSVTVGENTSEFKNTAFVKKVTFFKFPEGFETTFPAIKDLEFSWSSISKGSKIIKCIGSMPSSVRYYGEEVKGMFDFFASLPEATTFDIALVKTTVFGMIFAKMEPSEILSRIKEARTGKIDENELNKFILGRAGFETLDEAREELKRQKKL